MAEMAESTTILATFWYFPSQPRLLGQGLPLMLQVHLWEFFHRSQQHSAKVSYQYKVECHACSFISSFFLYV
jgi:hypothetical protein